MNLCSQPFAPTDWGEVLSNGLRDGGGKLSRPLLAN